VREIDTPFSGADIPTFEYKELHGKVLTLEVVDNDEATLLIGNEVETGIRYVLLCKVKGEVREEMPRLTENENGRLIPKNLNPGGIIEVEKGHGVVYVQSAKKDAGKLQLTLVPRQIIRDIAEVRMYGNSKYDDPDSWKTVAVERYRDAAFRHFLAYLDNPDGLDAESGLPHLAHLACNIAFLCEMERWDRDEHSRPSEDKLEEV
jgi:hypothetical protein